MIARCPRQMAQSETFAQGARQLFVILYLPSKQNWLSWAIGQPLVHPLDQVLVKLYKHERDEEVENPSDEIDIFYENVRHIVFIIFFSIQF